MTVEASEQLRNTMVDAVGSVLDGGFINFYTGSQPSDPDDAPTGTLLVSCSLDADAYAAAAAGSAAKNGVISGVVVADGDLGYAQQCDSISGNSMYGSVTLVGGGGDVEIDEVSLTVSIGQVIAVNTSVLSVPES